jgi:hypothetical protein
MPFFRLLVLSMLFHFSLSRPMVSLRFYSIPFYLFLCDSAILDSLLRLFSPFILPHAYLTLPSLVPVRIPHSVSHVIFPSTVTLRSLSPLADVAPLHPYLGL